jgi:predicted DNA-binding protein YlxM (UPF0122 family)
MISDKKLQAKNLYYQTELSKTQIAEFLNISRRSLHYWIKEGSWDRLKNSAENLPSIIAENCYHLMGHLTRHYLSETRITTRLTLREAETLHKLVITINKLKGRAALNENMEIFSFFLDGLKKRDPKLAHQLAPWVDEYISSRASVSIQDMLPTGFAPNGYINLPQTDYEEKRLDNFDYYEWETNPHSFMHDPDYLPTDRTHSDEPNQQHIYDCNYVPETNPLADTNPNTIEEQTQTTCTNPKIHDKEKTHEPGYSSPIHQHQDSIHESVSRCTPIYETIITTTAPHTTPTICYTLHTTTRTSPLPICFSVPAQLSVSLNPPPKNIPATPPQLGTTTTLHTTTAIPPHMPTNRTTTKYAQKVRKESLPKKSQTIDYQFDSPKTR